MKRAHLVLDEEALEEARRVLGARTYSDAVNAALREFVHRRRFAGVDEYASSGIWEGSLAEMREDRDVSD